MTKLPSGTVTLLFTDVEHSTELVKRLQAEYSAVLSTHRDLLRAAFASKGGVEVDTQGDAFFVAFAHVRDAVEAAVGGQRALSGYAWANEAVISVRMGLHTGEPHRAEHGYTGIAVHRAARICTIAHGGQVLLSRATAGIVDDDEIPGIALRDLGEVSLKDFDRPERIFQLIAEGLPSEYPPPRGVDEQVPLSGTVTIVGCEGRRMMRLMEELPAEHFGALLNEYQRLLPRVLEDAGGREVDVSGDAVAAAYPSPKQAALAAVAAQQAVVAHDWPYGLSVAIGVGLHSGEAGVGWIGRAVFRCGEICNAAEGGEIFMSQATASLLEDENLGELSMRDLGERQTRRTGKPLHVYELVAPSPSEPSSQTA